MSTDGIELGRKMIPKAAPGFCQITTALQSQGFGSARHPSG
jgi:hypothetical protein